MRYYMSQNIPENEIDGYVEQTLTLVILKGAVFHNRVTGVPTV